MKRIFFFLLIATCIGTASAQSYSDAFGEAFNRDDISAQREALTLWQQEAPNDVNLYIARYNFYANMAMREAPDKVVEALADSGLVAIDEGIAQYPDRLDLRFGKIYFLGELGRWDSFVDELSSTLDHSVQIDHRWDYPNVPDDMMEDFLMEGLSDHMVEMYMKITDTARLAAADSLMARRIQKVAKRAVQLFPSHFPSTYMLALSHLLLNENDKAYKYLRRAEGIDNTNVYLLQTLVKVCRLIGKAAQATEYQHRLESLSSD